MTMSDDMPLVLLDEVNSVLGEESHAEWEEECLNLEVFNFEVWKRACGLWKQTKWISKLKGDTLKGVPERQKHPKISSCPAGAKNVSIFSVKNTRF